MRWLWLILVLPFATGLVLVLLGSRRGPASTVAGALLLFFLAVPATVTVVAAVVLKIFRRLKSMTVGEMRG